MSPRCAPIRLRELVALGGGFGAEVRVAMDRRAKHLIAEGLAERRGRGVSFSRNLIETLRRFELDALGDKLAAWSPSLERQLGRHVSGLARGDGGIDWSFGRKRGLGL